jgi:TolB protein
VPGLSDLSVFGGPSWSPDGDKLVFSAYRGSRPPEIYTIGLDGSDLVQLTTCGRPCEGSAVPAWSPDGRWIAFARGSGGDGDLYVMDPAGSNVRRVTHCEEPGCAGEDSSPSWSPDGRTLVFERGEDLFSADLYVVPMNGGVPIRLTNTPELETDPDWGPIESLAELR